MNIILLLQTIAPAGSMSLLTLVRDFGIVAGLLMFFVWWAWNQNKGTVKRLSDLEDYVRTTLTDTLKENSKALDRVANGIEKCER